MGNLNGINIPKVQKTSRHNYSVVNLYLTKVLFNYQIHILLSYHLSFTIHQVLISLCSHIFTAAQIEGCGDMAYG